MGRSPCASTAAASIRRIDLPARAPELLGVSVETVTEIEGGWDYAVFEVNGAWMVRVPRRAEVRAWLRKETRLLPKIAPVLPLPVPRFDVVATEDDEPFVAYRKLPGRPLDAALRGTVDDGAIGRELGSFLAALHSFPEPRAMSLTRIDPESRGWLEQVEELHEGSERIVYPLLEPDERDRVDSVFEGFFASVDDVSPALVHGDLGPDHILCSTSAVTGVIDWSDATVGDPAIDFGWVLHSTPPTFVEGIHAGYEQGGRSLEPLLDHSLFYHRVGPLHEVLYGVEEERQDLLDRGLRGIRERLP